MLGADDTLALTVSYDGSGFAGSQIQPGVRTVQEVLNAALAGLFGAPVPTVFAGRTDAGVSAAGQVVSCPDRRPDLAPETLRRALNARLPDDVAVVALARKPARFNARYDAVWREYRYRIWCGAEQPLARRCTWQRRSALDVAAMSAAGLRLVGEHDFAAFAGGGAGVPWSPRRQRPRGTRRRVLVCSCRPIAPWWGPVSGELIEVRIVADGFLPRMVRNIVGVLTEVGGGARPAAWIDELLAARDRRAGGTAAPARGMTLWRIGYGDERPADA